MRGLLRALAKILVLNLLPNGRRVKPYGAGSVLFNRKPFLEDWAILFRLLEEGKIRPVISGEFPLLETAQANALLESDQVVGNLVLVAPELLEASRTISAASRQPSQFLELVGRILVRTVRRGRTRALCDR
jgi:hypothetical protein